MDKTRYWVACDGIRHPITRKQIKEAWEFFSGRHHDQEVLILKDGDSRLKDFKNFNTMDVE